MFLLGKVLLQKQKNIAILILNNPKSNNVLNYATAQAISRVLDEVGGNTVLQALIITGAEHSFSAGADLKELSGYTTVGALKWGSMMSRLMTKLETLEIPTIACVNGYALGCGAGLALCCDICMAAEEAVFSFPESGLGITPCGGTVKRMLERVGQQKTKELLYSGRECHGEEAQRIGLVSRVLPYDDLLQEAVDLAFQITTKGPIALGQIKKIVAANGDPAAELQAFGVCFSTEDQKMAFSAFLNKQKPTFKGK